MQCKQYTPYGVEQAECPETSAYKIQTPVNHPKKEHMILPIRHTILSDFLFMRRSNRN